MSSFRHWSDIGELGFVAGMRLLLWLYRKLGSWAFTVAAQPVVLYYFLANAEARSCSRQYLQRLQRCGVLDNVSWILVYRHFNAFARSAVDKLGIWADPANCGSISFSNRQLLLDQLDTGRGAILLGAHLGNMEICRSISRSNKRLKLNILVHTPHAERFNQLLRELQLHCELELIEVSQLSPATAIRLAACIERGEFIAVLADRVPVASRDRVRRIEFFGEPAPFPEGPFILASILKCPVYTLFCVPAEEGYVIRCDNFADRLRLPRRNRGEELERVMRRFVAVLESQVRAAPLQWFNFYRFWNQPK